MSKWQYREGGNPPINAGIFTEEGDRLAWWPAGFPPTHERMDIAYRLIIAREDDAPVGREILAAAFRATDAMPE